MDTFNIFHKAEQSRRFAESGFKNIQELAFNVEPGSNLVDMQLAVDDMISTLEEIRKNLDAVDVMNDLLADYRRDQPSPELIN